MKGSANDVAEALTWFMSDDILQYWPLEFTSDAGYFNLGTDDLDEYLDEYPDGQPKDVVPAETQTVE